MKFWIETCHATYSFKKFFKFIDTRALTEHLLSKPTLHKCITKLMKTKLFAIILTVMLMCQNMVIRKPFLHSIQITRKKKRMQMYSCKDTEKPWDSSAYILWPYNGDFHSRRPVRCRITQWLPNTSKEKQNPVSYLDSRKWHINRGVILQVSEQPARSSRPNYMRPFWLLLSDSFTFLNVELKISNWKNVHNWRGWHFHLKEPGQHLKEIPMFSTGNM
jgi:hypothetical protein